MNVHPYKLDKLKKRLKNTLDTQALKQYRAIVENSINELGMDLIDFAGALLQITHPHLLRETTIDEVAANEDRAKPPQQPSRNVRYRLDVGSNQQIDAEALIGLLIEESGVDRKRVGRLEIRDSYTLVDLPEGMPADIFQLLSEATINGHRLNIKRIKPNRKNPRNMRLRNG